MVVGSGLSHPDYRRADLLEYYEEDGTSSYGIVNVDIPVKRFKRRKSIKRYLNRHRQPVLPSPVQVHGPHCPICQYGGQNMPLIRRDHACIDPRSSSYSPNRWIDPAVAQPMSSSGYEKLYQQKDFSTNYSDPVKAESSMVQDIAACIPTHNSKRPIGEIDRVSKRIYEDVMTNEGECCIIVPSKQYCMLFPEEVYVPHNLSETIIQRLDNYFNHVSIGSRDYNIQADLSDHSYAVTFELGRNPFTAVAIPMPMRPQPFKEYLDELKEVICDANSIYPDLAREPIPINVLDHCLILNAALFVAFVEGQFKEGEMPKWNVARDVPESFENCFMALKIAALVTSYEGMAFMDESQCFRGIYVHLLFKMGTYVCRRLEELKRSF